MYSPSLEGGHCKFCILFAKGRDNLGLFITKPFTQFQKASEKLGQHFGKEGQEAQKHHIDAVADAMLFMSEMENKQK